MSGDARISGRIVIDPPITWPELAANRWVYGDGDNFRPDAVVRFDYQDIDTDKGVLSARVGSAIVPTGHETSARTLLDDVTRIFVQFRHTPDGMERRFSGWLHVIWGGGESVYRVHVVDGRAVESKPTLTWPVGARDEDGAP